MWSKDWVDVAVVISWVSVWSALVYFIPVGGV
ncbi:membrane protein [Vibrio galatheae]|uniref:Membrane protein n=1 Tax=Vibrio galatheae TaxID=579748 RepID=A0A0F4NL78_9VIBR|nr:membrane protein [Vibrio galatheae]